LEHLLVHKHTQERMSKSMHGQSWGEFIGVEARESYEA